MLPPFSMAVAATPRRADRMLESDNFCIPDRLHREAARSAEEKRQITGNRGASPFTYCALVIEESTGKSAVNLSGARIPCGHGEQVHARCMRDRAERLASGHSAPQPCFAQWSPRNRSPHPAELSGDLPRPRPEGRWSAVAGALQFAELLEENPPRLEPASYVTTGFHDTFEELVRTHGSRPTSSFLLCSLFGDVLGLPQGVYLDFPRPREWRAAAGHKREIFAACAIRPQDTVLRISRVERSTSYLMSKSLRWASTPRRSTA